MVQGTVADLLAAGLVSAGTTLTFERAGKVAEAAITADGQLSSMGSRMDRLAALQRRRSD
jgi:hypothetical protein